MKKYLAKILRRLGWIRFEFQVERHPVQPDLDDFASGTMVLVESAEIQKWACISCPGGCGQKISLSLNPNQRPRWTIITDFWQRPTIHPSIHQKNACGCHFWIKKGQVVWCESGRPPSTPKR